MIRRFFDVAIVEPATQTERPNIAALMAKHGVNNDTENPVATPISITPENKEEPKPAPEVTPAATATEPSNAEKANPESPSQQPEVKPMPEPQTAVAEVKPPTLQEVLKQHQPDAIYKELGVDADMVSLAKKIKDNPKMVAFFNHWETNGDVKPYLRELSTDYASMSAEDVMRHQLQNEYPKSSPQQFEALYRAKVVRAYNLESTDEDEKLEGRMLLEAEAERHREGLIKNQQNYLFPPKPEPKPQEPDTRAIEAKEVFEGLKGKLNNNQLAQNIVKIKAIPIGEGDDIFNMPIPESQNVINEILGTVESFAQNGQLTKQNIADYTDEFIEKQILTAIFSHDPKEFIKQMSKHFKSKGGESVTNQLENPSQPGQNGPSTTETAPKTAAEAMAKGGTYNSGGYNR
jgi:hypothetical protein